MLKHSTRRWLAGLGVAGAFVAASATPASAEEADVKLGVYFADTTIAADSEGKVDGSIIYSSEPVVLHDLTIRYDYRDLAGKVVVTSESQSSECTTPEPNVLLCVVPYEVGIEDEWGLGGVFPVVLAPTDAAADGDAGVLKVSLSAKGFEPVTHDAKVRVGEGVDLAAGDPTEISAAPGKKFTSPLTVSNVGDTAADGATVFFYNDYAIRADKQYSNCTYDGDRLRSCRFDEALAPGGTYGSTLAYALGADTFAPGFAFGEIVWMTSAELEDFEAYLASWGVTAGKPGTGGKLTLTAQSDKAQARGVQADTDPDNNWSYLAVTVTGNNSTDLEALGARVAGGKGAEVVATVGFRNNGPATLDHGRSGSSVTNVAVEIPQGTSAIGVPDSCMPQQGDDLGEPGEPGARTYFCYTPTFIKAGDEETVEFTLRIDEVIPNAAGTVKVNVPCQCDGGFYKDLKPANDTAKILVNATGNGGGEGGGEGDGPTLPITGDSTTMVAGIGGLLLAAGAAGFVVARRRRTRFVA